MIINNWCSNTTLLIWLYNNILPRRRAPAEDIADSTDSSPNGEFSYPTRYDAYWPKQVKSYWTTGCGNVTELLWVSKNRIPNTFLQSDINSDRHNGKDYL